MSNRTFSINTALRFIHSEGAAVLGDNSKKFALTDPDAEDHLGFLEAATNVCLINGRGAFNNALYNYLCTEPVPDDGLYQKTRLAFGFCSRMEIALFLEHPLLPQLGLLYGTYNEKMGGCVLRDLRQSIQVNESEDKDWGHNAPAEGLVEELKELLEIIEPIGHPTEAGDVLTACVNNHESYLDFAVLERGKKIVAENWKAATQDLLSFIYPIGIIAPKIVLPSNAPKAEPLTPAALTLKQRLTLARLNV